MSAASPPARIASRRLPFTLYVLASLMLLKAVLLLGVVAGATFDVLQPIFGLSTAPDLVVAIRTTPGASTILVVFALLLVVSVIGMLARRRIGWLLAMVVTGLFVALDIYGYRNDGANHLWAALNVVTVFYLNQRDVRETVGAAVSLTADAEQGEA